MSIHVEAELSLSANDWPHYRYVIRGDHGTLERSEHAWVHEVRALEEGRIVAVVDYEADPETLVIW